MRLTQKSKDILELLFIAGVDMLTNMHRLHSVARFYGDWSENSPYFRQLRSIRGSGLVDWDDSAAPSSWVPQLTELGYRAIQETIDPPHFWNQRWDGQWRTLTFDLPRDETRERKRLEVWLQQRKFGHLQGSLWLTPRPYSDWAQQLETLQIHPRYVIFMEGRPLGKLSDSEIVASAWDAPKLEELQEQYLNFLSSNHPSNFDADNPEREMALWFREECRLWRETIEADPLHPKALLPPSYRGFECWEARQAAFDAWKKKLHG